MQEINLSEIVAEIFSKHHCSFMTVKQVVSNMPMQLKRDLGVAEPHAAVELQKIFEPMLDDRYVFSRRGTWIYIQEARKPEEFIFDALNKRKELGKTAGRIWLSVPFSKKECSKILGQLVRDGKVILKLEDDLVFRFYPAENAEENETQNPSEYTLENFRTAFDALDNGRIFVRICDLRKKLNWPRNVFDQGLRQFRDAGIIQLHVGDVSLMTREEIDDCFIDENNIRMGTVTWHGK